ncbi:MAG: VanZ family protein [Bacteroidales bacterium]|nr:VanZ family protein [Bacteroidales bacterium]
MEPVFFNYVLIISFIFWFYFLICMYYLVGQWKGFKLFHRNAHVKFLVLVILLGTITEVLQIFIPARAFNVMDSVANLSGVLVGYSLIRSSKKTPHIQL